MKIKKIVKKERQKQRQKPSEAVRNRQNKKVVFLTLSDAKNGFVRNSLTLFKLYNNKLQHLSEVSETSEGFFGVLNFEQ